MKKKLLLFKADMKSAKDAWLAARKDSKKTKEEVKTALDHYQELQAFVEGAESEGKKDDDEVEMQKAGTAGDPNVLEMDALKGMIGDAVKEQLAASLPEALKGQVTADGIKQIVADALAAHKVTDAKKVGLTEVQSVVKTAVEEQMKKINLPSKIGGGAADDATGKGAGAGGGRIEIPCSLRKGNLPLHMKQLVNVLLRKNMNDGIDAELLTKGADLGDRMFASYHYGEGIKALTTGGTGTGAEWIPRDLGSELYRRLYLESTMAQLMAAREIQMPTDPYDLPLALTRPKFYKNAIQNREGKSSDAGTGKFTLTTAKLMALVQYSYEANEDAIIPLLPILQQLLGEAAAFSLEDAIINGDTTATHQDSDVTDADDHRTIWKGFRKLALADAALKVDLSTGGISRANCVALKKKLKKWGRNPNDLAFIVGTQGENDFLNLDDVTDASKLGGTPTTVSGTINKFLNIPLVVSEAAREDLNASGVYDGSTTTKGSLILVNLSQFVMGNRREFTLEVDRNIRSQTNDIVASFRKAFQPQETPSSTVPSVVIGYNYNS